jgi:hypothetical protein
MTRPSHPSWFDYSNYTWRRVQVVIVGDRSENLWRLPQRRKKARPMRRICYMLRKPKELLSFFSQRTQYAHYGSWRKTRSTNCNYDVKIFLYFPTSWFFLETEQMG